VALSETEIEAVLNELEKKLEQLELCAAQQTGSGCFGLLS
jgi:hypothetical protein